ncbi:MAG: YegS/Rv2252/BmrU family lipid kinase [Eubacteriales bacterium]|nr:YegS/Rv2252/BmrU family lipid kinase [Eubacteriales bacterium]
MSKNLLLILNPCSGKMKGLKHLTDICEIFYEADYTISLHTTTKSGDATEFVRLWGQQADLIVCVGGDGTFNEVVDGIMLGAVTTPIGYIPMGSTNDFASSLKIPKSWKKAAKAIVMGTPRRLDVCKFNERYFSYVASCGAFTKTSYSTPQKLKNALGHLAYLLEGIKDIPSIKPIHMCVSVGDKVFEGDYIFAAFSNSTSMGGILKLDPKLVDMNDGLMEIMLVPSPKNAGQLAKVLSCLQKKKYISPYLEFMSASNVSVVTNGDFDWSLDGEKYEGCQNISIDMQSDAITLIL